MADDGTDHNIFDMPSCSVYPWTADPLTYRDHTMTWYNPRVVGMYVTMDEIEEDSSSVAVRFVVKYHPSMVTRTDLARYGAAAEDFIQSHVYSMVGINNVITATHLPSPPGLESLDEDEDE